MVLAEQYLTQEKQSIEEKVNNLDGLSEQEAKLLAAVTLITLITL